MGVNPTPTNFKTFTFDGENSRNYGVYITGAGVFNAPERNVEMVDIPGRNGAFALDKGNFNNIEVTYPAGIFADTEADFAQAVSDLRNLLCSKVGYVRLEDDYNPNEYRLAIYKSGLDVDHDFLIAGEFELVFECKPQRYLKSGETAISVTSGNTITNPTRFEAKPLLEVISSTGGVISFGLDVVASVTNSPLGRITLANGADRSFGFYTTAIDGNILNSGDTIFIEKAIMTVGFGSSKKISTATKTNESGDAGTSGKISNDNYNIYCEIDFADMTFAYGTSSQYTRQFDVSVVATDASTSTEHVKATISYDGNNAITMSPSVYVDAAFVWISNSVVFNSSNITATSSVLSLSLPVFIDCDGGECYIVSNSKKYSVNSCVSLGSELPTLKLGTTTIYHPSLTTLKVTPRWWQV